MQRDYYAFRLKEHLRPILRELDESHDEPLTVKKTEKIEERVKGKPTNELKKKVRETAEKLSAVEPHLAYLYYEALSSELKDYVLDAWRRNVAISDNPWSERPHYDFAKMPELFQFIPADSVLTYLPLLSFIIRIPFQLEKPYFSRDEREFYLLDNPLRRDKIFQTPLVAATSWKGALRAAMIRQLADWWGTLGESAKKDRRNRKEFVGRRLQLARLFGTEKGVQPDENEDDHYPDRYLDKLGGENLSFLYRRYISRFLAANGFFAGRLYFFPTFFKQVGLEVVNPHSPETGVPTRGPIFMETVRGRGSQKPKGDFLILYVPFYGSDPIKKNGESERMAKDLFALIEGLQAMFLTYGFGAKTSSGFGKAEDRLAGNGQLVIKTAVEAVSQESSPRPNPLKIESQVKVTFETFTELVENARLVAKHF